MKLQTIGILGAGLIGGSLAQTLRAARPDITLLVGDTDAATREAVQNAAVAARVFDPRREAPAEVFSGCELVVFAMPPQAVIAELPNFADSPVPLLTDVCSVKKPILEAAARAGIRRFIGGHPMAGTEGAGFGAARAGLFRNAAFICCECAECCVERETRAAFEALLRELGFRTYAMSAEAHDRRLALISHLPHAASFALSALAAQEEDPLLAQLFGGGFRDTTRIAASSPALWTDILRASPELPGLLDRYIQELKTLREALSPMVSGKELHAHLQQAQVYRCGIPDGLNRVPHAISQ